jgi:hypothetical protein
MLCYVLLLFFSSLSLSCSWASRRSIRHLGIPVLGVRHISRDGALALGYYFTGVELDEHCSVGF